MIVEISCFFSTKHSVQTSYITLLESETWTWMKSGNRFSLLESLNMCLLWFIKCTVSCFYQFCCLSIPSFPSLDDLVAQMVCYMVCYLVCSVWCRTLSKKNIPIGICFYNFCVFGVWNTNALRLFSSYKCTRIVFVFRWCWASGRRIKCWCYDDKNPEIKH